MANIPQLGLSFLSNNKAETERTFTIINENQNQQILQIVIPPNCSNYIRGKIIYSNYFDQSLPTSVTPSELKYRFKKGISMYLWRNKTQQMQVVGLKHLECRGPILIIDLSVYRESLCVNLNKIIATKYNIQSCMNTLPKLPNYILIQYNEKATSLEDFFRNNQKIALQTNAPILEKYLGVGEELVIYNGDPIAYSKTLLVQKLTNGQKFTGPGWLFFQTNFQDPTKDKRVMLSRLLLLLFAYSALFFVLNYI